MTDSQTKVLAVLRLMTEKFICAVWYPSDNRWGGNWWAWTAIPKAAKKGEWYHSFPDLVCIDSRLFDLPRYEGNWQDSLVERNAKDGE
jgi:hypothetical protein